jgi:hypothetical protein
MATTAGRFSALFNGLPRAYGIYIVPPPSQEKGSKRAGDARTVQAPVTEELWARHLSGEIQLGIVPVRDDATCVFGAIDVDDYATDHPALGAKIKQLQLPLIMCRSKSGGAHLYAFFNTPVEAVRVRELLAGWAAQLGYATVEVFPKQDALHSTQDTGNWINMPYSGGAGTERYALLNAKPLGPEAFLDYSERHKVPLDTVNSTAEFPELLTEAPPCLVTLANGGIPEGQRNNTMFNLAIYARKRWPGEWEEKVPELNASFVSPPLSSSEVSEMIKNVGKKEYNYTCKQEPICSVCQRSVCKNRAYGVNVQQQADTFGLLFENVVRLQVQPVVYFADYAGKRVSITSKHITNQASLRQSLVEQANVAPPRMNGRAFDTLTNSFLAKALIVEAPLQTASDQRIRYQLAQYCGREAPNRHWRSLSKGGSRKHEGRVYFDPRAFVNYVNHNFRGGNTTESDVWLALLKAGIGSEVKAVSNGVGSMPLNLWYVPEGTVEFFDEEGGGDENEF